MTERFVPGHRLLHLGIALLSGILPLQAANPPPTQVFYVPVPESDQLAGYTAINGAAVDPLHVFVTFSAASDQTVIYYDQWEDGYEEDITNPTQSTTLVFGDGNPANGYPPGNAADLISAGTVFSLRNYIYSTAGASTLKYDARDKIASFKPISLTKTSFPASTNSLLAGCLEVFERGLWGTEYRVPVGANMPTTTATSTLTWDADVFAYTALSIMAGAGGANVQIDANNDGVFEQTVSLAEGASTAVSGVSVGARVLADKPVQVILFTGRPGSNYQSRDTSLLPTYRWSNSYYAPVSTPSTYGTVVFLYNPGTSAITVNYDYRSSNTAYTTASVSVPAGGNARVTLAPASGTTHYGAYKFYTTGTTPPVFYAFCAVDAASTTITDNQAYDGGFTLVGQPSLTTQVLLSLGIGRDPYSTTNMSENGNPVWVTTVGNGHTLETVYVDYNGDNAGPLTDPNGNRYDVAYSVRELQQLKLFDPDGDQSGMLVYTLNPNVKIAAAWAQDPAVASAGQPGLDVSTLIPPLREGEGAKGSSIAVDADGDGNKSAGDTLEYDIRTINTARTSMVGPFTVRDTLPTDVTYVPGSVRYRYSVNNAWQAWVTVPDDSTGTPFPLDGTGFAIPGTLNVRQQIQVTFLAVIKPYASLTPGASQITNTGSIVVTPYGITVDLSWSDVLHGSIGDRVWIDTNGNGVQDSGEAGLNNVTVFLDLNNNGSRDANEPTSVTSGNGAYVFNGLIAGTYRVRVDPATVAALNPGYGPTYDIDGVATSYGATVTLASAQDRVDVDFGFRVGASVGDRVWLDRDGDGVQEPGEPGINGVRVYIDSNNNGTFDSTEPNSFTSGDGDYYIGNLNAGTYTVRVDATTLPSGATQTFDVNGPGDNAAPVTLVGATHRPEYDFGYRGNLSIGDQVWNDVDGNGLLVDVISFGGNGGMLDMNRDGSITAADAGLLGGYTVIAGRVDVDGDGDTDNDDDLDTNTFMGLYRIINGRVDINLSGTISTADTGRLSGEQGIANVRVYIDVNGDGAFNAIEPSAVTNASGIYSITNLFNGTYTVRVDTTSLPSSFVPTYDLTAPVTDHQATVVLSGASRTDVDYGYRNDASIGDLVWNDRDGDGVVDPGEPGIEGVLVYIDANGNDAFDQGTERFAFTNNAGYYNIPNLPAGSYSVRIEISTIPVGATQTYDLDGTGTSNEAARTLTVSEDAVNVDFGYRATASVGDLVWNDANANGVLDSGETGISGVRVYLDINGNGVFDSATEPSAVTNASGVYTISNLLAGTYTARIDTSTLAATLVQTYDFSGALDNAATFSISATQARTDIDFGYTTRVTIGDFVWNDVNANGQQDSGETGIPGVTVTAYNATNNTIAATTTTGTGGAYSFSMLLPGTYYLVFDRPSGYNATLADRGSDTTDSDANPTTGRTANITLTGGQSSLIWDAGFYQPVTIGDFVWNDVNANGQQDSGETGLAGVTVTLYRPGFGPDGISGTSDDAAAVGTATTNASGAYSFSGLPPGTYQVGFGALSGYNRTLASQGAAASDSDANAGTGLTATFAVSAGQTNNAIDAGYFQPGSIGDFVWNDANANGQQDSGEAGISGVAVSLYRPGFGPDGIAGNSDDATEVATATTNGSGAYAFSGLRPGTYRVTFGAVSGFNRTLAGQGAAATDSDANASTGQTGDIVLAAGQAIATIDAGYYQPASIGDFVWNDVNANGQQDSGETGLAGVTVSLFRPGFGPDGISGTSDDALAVTSVVTGSNGAYSFTGIAPGLYRVGFGALSGYGRTLAGQGAAATDSDANPTNGLTSSFAISAGQSNLTIDAGYYQTVSIGDFVWNDANANGQQDSGETGLEGVTVNLYRPGFGPDGIAGNSDDADVVASMVTPANGAYSFTGIAPGTYQVGFGTLAGYNRTLADQGNDSTDSDANASTGRTASYVLAPGQSNSTIDAGYYAPITIGDFVWNDVNANGQQDSGEVGLAGVTVSLYRPGFGPDGIAGNSDDATAVASVVTGSNGAYSFTGIAPGTYQIGFGALSGYGRTLSGQGAAATDSDANASTGLTATFAVAAGQSNLTIDAGYFQSVSIGDFVWNDINANGQQDSGETGLAGVTVSLYRPGFGPDGIAGNADDATAVTSVVTGSNGAYSFSGIAPGTYQVGFGTLSGYNRTLADQGNDATDSDANASTGRTASYVLAPGQSNLTIDAGYYAPITIGDFVWNDVNANGQQDSGETGLAGVTVSLYRPGFGPDGIAGTSDDAAVVASVVTGSNGAYSFTGIAPGTYQVGFGTLSGYGRTLTGQGTAATDSDANASTGLTATFAVAAGQSNLTIDAGYYQTVSIGDFVWNDVNANGQQDSGETGLAGVTVSLYRPGFGPDGIAGNADDATAVTSVVTGSNGAYSFTGIAPGSYQVGFGTLSGYNRTLADQGNDATDSDANVSTGRTVTYVLSGGQSNTTIDAGYYAPVTIGDFVWNDVNANGQQDSGETGLAGVTVSLYRPGFGPDGIAGNSDDATVVASVVTGSNGAYSFSGIAPGTYQVGFGALSGYGRSPAGQGAAATDSDANVSTGLTATFAVAAGQSNLTIDAGYYQSVTIGDFVWNDVNANGQQDSGETGLAGVTVSLYRPGFGPDGIGGNSDDATAVASVVTGSNGAYSFTGIAPGTYQVGFGSLSGYGRTLTGQGTSATDSDANASTGLTATFAVAAGQSNLTIDAGYYQTVSIGDFVWNDANANGQQDSGETGLAGVTVSLYRPGFGPDGIAGNADDATAVTSVVTGSNGAYSFTGIAPGSYQVGFGTLSGYNRTLADQGNDATDSDANASTGRTVTYVLSPGQSNTTIDAGYYAPVTIGDFVWNDANANGQQDSGETGLAGVTVSLYRPGFGPDGIAGNSDDATAVASVVTGSNGAYSFTGIAPGTYQVGFGTLSGYNRTPSVQGNDATNSDANVSTGRTTSFVLAQGQSNLTIDAGYYMPGSISGSVLADTNNDNSGDVGIQGVTVVLKDASGNDIDSDPETAGVQPTTTVTNSNGAYTFANLMPGSYRVAQIQPSGYLSVGDVDGANNNVIGDETPIVVAAGQAVTGRDFIEEQPAILSGHLYVDTNGNGQQDSGEPDLEGVDVIITDSNGGTQTVTTGANGNWSASVPPGVTGVDVQESDPQFPAGSTQTEGTDPTQVTTYPGAAADGGTNGYFLPGSITGFVLADTDNDGIGDSPLAGVVLTLLGADGNPVDGNPALPGVQLVTTVTAANGSYGFTNLSPGVYGVAETQPSGYNSLSDKDGGNPDEIRPITVVAGTANSGNNFIEEQTGTISGNVLVDTDNDGTGDSPLAGVVLSLLDSNGDPVLDGSNQPVTATTQADGSYSFTGIAPGEYRVVQAQPSGYGSVGDSDGANNNVIGDETPITVTAGGSSSGNDFTEILLGSIGGSVLADTDNDGTGDTGLAGVLVSLLDSNGNPVLDGSGQPVRVTTGPDGSYIFTGVFPGSYRISETQPAGYASVGDVDGANNNVIGDETPVTVAPGQAVTGRNFVEIEFGSIAGNVRDDTDANGSGDAPLEGVTVRLLDGSGQPVLDGSGQPVTTVTGADGSYSFSGLLPGNYQVAEVQPVGYGSVSDVDGGNPDLIGNITPISVAPGATVTGRDFVDVEFGSITGYVMAGSSPLSGVTLTLLDASGNPVDADPSIPGVQLITTVTDSNGRYTFNNVMPGNYGVAQTQPAGYNSFGDLDGGDLDIIGDVTPIVVLPGQENSGNNFVETLDTCPDTWAEWLFQHPGETSEGNPDADRYDNLDEFAFAMPADSGAGDAWRIRPSTTAPGTVEGVFTRPRGAYQNVTYSLEFVNTLASPIVWQSFEIEPSMVTVVANADCTETVTIHDLETLTGLTAGEGFVRIRVDLYEDEDETIDHTSYTEVEGWKETGFEICCRTYNNPFLRDTTFTGTVTGVTGQTLDLSGSAGATDISSLMATGAYYVEVVSGDNEGHRFDVVSATTDTITLATDSNLDSASAPHNTRTGALPANLAGDSIVLRRHWTLGEMFPADGFGATNDPATADQVQLFAGGQWISFWLSDAGPNPSRWVNIADGSYADQANFVLPPGYGSFFNNRHAPTSLLAYGEVRENDFVRPLATGMNFVSGGYPLDQSPAGENGRAMTVDKAFFGSRDIATADTIYLWKADTVLGSTGYTSYFLNDNAPRTPRVIKWARVGDASLVPQDSATLLPGNRSAFVRSRNGIGTYTMPSPWAP